MMVSFSYRPMGLDSSTQPGQLAICGYNLHWLLGLLKVEWESLLREHSQHIVSPGVLTNLVALSVWLLHAGKDELVLGLILYFGQKGKEQNSDTVTRLNQAH